MNYRVDIEVTAPVQATEVEDRVRRAVTAIFPTAEVRVTDDAVRAEAHSVERFAELLEDQRIVDTARSQLRSARTDQEIRFRLKKQAALHETVNFSVGNPDELGDITVVITVQEPDAEAFIDYLAPSSEIDESESA